ncbi:MAG: hypothetical protein GX750_05110 [Clostridia bacterium]|nr:hypothetical protein [Clostridia bacterium]
MAMGFWRGIITGGIIGGIITRLLGSPAKKPSMEEMSQQVDKMRVKAEKMMNDAREGVRGMYRKK